MQIIFPHGMRSRLLSIALTAIVIGCGGSQPSPPSTPLEGGSPAETAAPAGASVRIVFLGDSLSAGFGLAESQAFPSLVQQGLRASGRAAEVLNAGVSGDTTAGGLARLDWVLRSEPDLLVVELGGNDALRGQPLANIESNLRQIVRRGRDSGAQVLLLGMDVPTNYGRDYATGFAELYDRIARDEEVAFLPGFVHDVALDPDLMMEDGIHPTAEGHRRLADSLVEAIEPLLPPG